MTHVVQRLVPAAVVWVLGTVGRWDAAVLPPGEEDRMTRHWWAAVVLSCVTACAEEPTGLLVPDLPVHLNPVAPLDTTVVATGDAMLYAPHPDDHFGTLPTFQVGLNGTARAVVQWDQAVLQALVGPDSVAAARLVMRVEQSTGWGHTGGVLAVHRLTTAWTEAGATWHCAIDAVPGNGQADCAGPTAWQLADPPGPVPWVAAASDSVVVLDGLADTVSWDVTADVRGFVAGVTPNYGFVLVGPDGSAGSVTFTAREGPSGAAPYLQLTLVPQDTARPPLPDFFGRYDTTIAVSPPYSAEVAYYRNILQIEFDDTTSGTRVNEILATYQAEIVGGFPNTGTYVIRVPDPGPTIADLDSLIASLRAEPGVRLVGGVKFRDDVRGLGRYPVDGGLVSRQT